MKTKINNLRCRLYKMGKRVKTILNKACKNDKNIKFHLNHREALYEKIP